ncbi:MULTISPECIES: tryptophan transporter [Geobacillus]|uniref:Tryptophan transporter n=2 Tax=Geobacillus thermodenitrificans TaxID=33940 RepID=A0ABY9QHJ8_GEOTD|nr:MULTISPECIES: tryptophan transporter [Geobacillus]ABO65942.1 Putative tryptophan transport protein [Geobacillus thermodenitrificans NG80-2]ARA97620.1 tryptophan transporter [Geobacillus thermodenitrificans]ARP41673.1 putative tryptophan transport protein [Geobacillus thermodenitrificans]ATO36947.1 tryptophan transporter [Geobacillus thermodenitrificans]KQB94269.1 tryptophan transporter [Geobacillus sp. PA-3]
MNVRTLVSMALLVGIGAVLHAVIPGLFAGMKPDMMLAMMFLAILLFPSAKAAGIVGVATGLISAMTTTFPGGQLPNVIDKIITAFVVFALVTLLKKYSQTVIGAAVLTAVGTVISGVVFLTAVLLIVGLPGEAAFSTLFVTVVLPAAALNTVAMVIVYPIVASIFRRMNVTAHV